MQLTKNFKLSEFSVSSSFPHLADPVPDKLIPTVQKLAEELQKIRDAAGVPMVITSGYRSKALNKAVGGSATSQHTKAEAVDVSAGVIIFEMLLSGKVQADIGQVISYPNRHFIHIALPSKKYPKPTFFLSQDSKVYNKVETIAELRELGL